MPSSSLDLIGFPDTVAPASLGCTGTTLQPLRETSPTAVCEVLSLFNHAPIMWILLMPDISETKISSPNIILHPIQITMNMFPQIF